MSSDIRAYSFEWRYYSSGEPIEGGWWHTFKSRQMEERRSVIERHCASCGNAISPNETHLVDSSKSVYRVHCDCATVLA